MTAATPLGIPSITRDEADEAAVMLRADVEMLFNLLIREIGDGLDAIAAGVANGDENLRGDLEKIFGTMLIASAEAASEAMCLAKVNKLRN